ncbi:MAG: transglycosylase SLT domain-containing protein [Nitrospiria bacterium]
MINKTLTQYAFLMILLQVFFSGCATQRTAILPASTSTANLTASLNYNRNISKQGGVSQPLTLSSGSFSSETPGKDVPVNKAPSLDAHLETYHENEINNNSKLNTPNVQPSIDSEALSVKESPTPDALTGHNNDPSPQINQDLPPLEENDLEEDSDEKESEESTYDIPIVKNETVQEYINYYQTRNRAHFELWLTRSGRYLPSMKEIFKSFDLPEDLVFLALIESGFNPHAYSRSKASGPWQFMKATGKKYGLKVTRWVDERRDPIKSTYAAAKYLKDLYAMFGSWPLALASYNAGEGKVLRAMARTKAEDFWDLSSTRYLRPETKNYVPQFMAATIIAKNPEKFGFSLSYYEPLKFETVYIDRSTDLRVISRVVRTSYEGIKELNPELKKGMTPPLYPNYPLRIPEGTKSLFEENFRKVPDNTKVLKQKHRVRKGETLLSLSKRFGVPLQDLAETNGLDQNSKLHKGKILIIPLGKADQSGDNSPVVSPKSNLKIGASLRSCNTCKNRQRYTLYKVRKGDTLYRLSKRYDVEIASLKRFNHIRELKVGSRLMIPLVSAKIG